MRLLKSFPGDARTVKAVMVEHRKLAPPNAQSLDIGTAGIISSVGAGSELKFLSINS